MSEADDVGAQQRYRYQHERREEEFDDFDGDANVLDGILRVLASLADEARAKVNAFYDASEVSDARILLLLLFFVLFSLVLAHFIAARVILNGGFGSKRNTALGGRRSKKRDSIVLCGQDGAGSTSAYLLLKNKSLGLGTVTSMKENESEVEIRATSDTDDAEKITKVNVIDLPGHAKIRKRFYERFLPRAKCIVFFVDGVEFSTNKKDVADHLYHEILIDYENVRRKRIPILIACNKMDKTESCSPASFVKKRLESEIETIRITRDVMLEDAKFDDGSRKSKKRAKEIEKKRERELTGLGWKDEWGKFSFDVASRNKTHGRFTFCACSCVGEDEAWKNKDDDGGGEKTSANRVGGVNLSAVKAFAIEHGRR